MCPVNHTDRYANGVVYYVSATPFMTCIPTILSKPGYREILLP